jgi:N6-adenosine-specific RNA methylase IME4
LEPLLAEKNQLVRNATLKQNATETVVKNFAQRNDPSENKTRTQAAAAAGVSHPTYTAGKTILERGVPELQEKVKAKQVSISAAAEVATLPRPEQAKVVAMSDKEILAKAKEIRSAKTEVRRQERVEKLVEIATGNRPLDTVAARYPVIYADPPWRYEHAESESRAIENQYPTMTLDEICSLPLDTITTPDAILFLWTTSPKLEEGMRVVRDWGFTYRTCAVWDKEKIGMGYYFRQAHELLLVATKGSMPTPPPAARPSSVLRAARGEHSAKPDEMRDAIERMYPELPKVEMFCRSPKPGWAVWGNQS